MKLKTYFLTLFFLIFSGYISAQNWQQINSVEEVCKAYPEKMEYIFQNLNLDFKGLENVKTAYQKGDLPKACELLLEYYKTSESAKQLKKEQPNISQKTTSAADSIIHDIYTFQNVAGQVPRLDDGHLKWSHNGPEDDIEWAWALNRHYPVSYLLPLYFETGNPEYAKYIDSFTKDWIIQSWPYPAVKSSTAMWRGLEVSFRVKTWAQVFFGLMNTDFISPATKLLILSSLPDHAHYARYFHAQNNWLTMEISGLATVATAWPEFKQAEEWLNYSIEVMAESMKDQVYVDGAQTELTSSYHYVALLNFELFKNLCNDAGKKLPDFFNKTLEDMYNYLALTIRPDGYGLLNNDADLIYNREIVLKAAEEYNRDDWKYIVTNGKEGIKPKYGPSFILPWAGHLISRNGYDTDAHWSFFDMGPWGSGHQHNDKMHISVAAFGRDLLVDCGRFAYRGEVADKFRKYATGSQSHNVLLVDGKGQAPGPKVTDEPVSKKDYLITEDYDLGRASFAEFGGLDGICKHTRTLFYSRGDLWVVVDQVTTDRPRKIDALWHWHPENKLKIENDKVYTANERGNLQIIPAGNQKWEVKMVKGQEQYEIQGWYSKEYNIYEPNPTTIYTTKIESNSTFVWVLYPSEKVEKLVRAEIVSESPKEIKVKIINEKNDEWVVDVPLE
jgi:hypothetical protein